MAFLDVKQITKSFGSTRALRGVSLQVEPGEIHAILGQNGAGKTTLMNILYGLLSPDSGTLEIRGESYRPSTPQDAMRAGVGMVHQHFMLVETLTVLENIYLGEAPFSMYRSREMEERVSERIGGYAFDLPLHEKVGNLSVGERQQVEIYRALWKGAQLLILDEPTAVLAPQQIRDLFRLLKELRSNGHSVLFISHKLQEIQDLCDRVTLLRTGETLGTFNVAQLDAEQLARLVSGDDQPMASRRKRQEPQESQPFLIRPQSSPRGRLKGDWTCSVYPGQVTAIAGVEGNGQRELAEAILGVSPTDTVSIDWEGELLPKDPPSRIRSGIGLISEDRQRTGLVMEFSVTENLALKDVDQKPWSHRGFLSSRGMNQTATEWIRRYQIDPADPLRPVSELSGGNQQKVVVAREISRNHRLLVAFNPTRGLDVGACKNVYQALTEDAKKGAAILLISTELEEILDLADHVSVIYRGRLTPIPREDCSVETIGLAMLGQGEGNQE